MPQNYQIVKSRKYSYSHKDYDKKPQKSKVAIAS